MVFKKDLKKKTKNKIYKIYTIRKDNTNLKYVKTIKIRSKLLVKYDIKTSFDSLAGPRTCAWCSYKSTRSEKEYLKGRQWLKTLTTLNNF